MADLIYTGHMRLHYNRHGAAPLLWCVSVADSWEVAVRDIVVRGADVASVYAPKPVADEDDGKPSAWFSVYGRLTVDEFGIATIEPVRDQKETR